MLVAYLRIGHIIGYHVPMSKNDGHILLKSGHGPFQQWMAPEHLFRFFKEGVLTEL